MRKTVSLKYLNLLHLARQLSEVILEYLFAYFGVDF